jgi:phosphate transport system permease protein
MSEAQSLTRPAILSDPERRRAAGRSIRWRRMKNRAFFWLCVGVASLSLLVLAVLLTAVTWQGVEGVNRAFLSSRPSPNPAEAGIYPALLGTVWVCVVCGVVALPLGVATAMFLEEFRPRPMWMRRVHGFIQLNIANLAGVPSVVYGIVGLTAFVSMFGLVGSPKSPALELGVNHYDQYYNDRVKQVVLVPVESGTAERRPLRDGMPVRVDGRRAELNLIGPDAPFPKDEALASRTLRAGSEPGRISEKQWS